MEALANLVIATADLVEAEGRTLKRSVVRLGVAAALSLVALLVAILGVGFVLFGIYLLLARVMSEPAAAVVFGSVSLVTAGGLIWWARTVLRR